MRPFGAPTLEEKSFRGKLQSGKIKAHEHNYHNRLPDDPAVSFRVARGKVFNVLFSELKEHTSLCPDASAGRIGDWGEGQRVHVLNFNVPVFTIVVVNALVRLLSEVVQCKPSSLSMWGLSSHMIVGFHLAHAAFLTCSPVSSCQVFVPPPPIRVHIVQLSALYRAIGKCDCDRWRGRFYRAIVFSSEVTL